VTGTVTSGTDQTTLPGVAVQIKGTSKGVTTNIDGQYTIEVPSSESVLVYSFYGFVDQEQTVGNRTTINVVLNENVEQLKEVVVTAFGLEKEEKALSYAVQAVDGEKLNEAREANIVNSLSGRIAGVQVTNSNGAPGASSRIVLRGGSSITGNNQPLFVVDGIPIDNGNYGNAGAFGGADFPNGAADINPNDVASVTVLKGANAAALYGSRASNGVILITTKSGRGTKGLGVSVNSQVTFETPLRLPSYQNSYGGGYDSQYFEYLDGTRGSGGEDESWGPALDKGLEFIQWNSFDGQPLPWVSRPDNVRNFFETGNTISNNVALTGGNENTNFRLSLTDFRQKGMVPNTELERKTISLNGGTNLSDKLRADASINYVRSGSDNIPGGGYDNNNPMQQFTWFQRNVDIEALKDFENLPLAANGTAAAGTPANWNTNYNNNPYWILYNNTQGFNKDRVYGNIRLNYQFTDALSLMVRTGTDFFTDLQEIRRAVGSNDYPNGTYIETDRTRIENNTDALLTYNNNFGDFGLNVTAGGNIRTETYSRNQLSAPELEIPGVYNVSNSKVAVTADNYDERREVQSLLGSAEFSFRNYLFLTATARNDWSSALPSDNRSYFYPSVSASAVISDMIDINSDVITLIKLRGGWAKVGADTNPYRLRNVYAFFDPWGGSLITPTTSNTLLNPTLRSETTTSTEIGADLRFFNDRLGFDVTYYNKLSYDNIIPVEISATTGYTSFFANVGELSNKGWEVQISGVPIKTSDFSWNVNVNYSRNVSEVNTLGGDLSNLETLELGGQWNVDVIAKVGEQYPVLYGPDFQRDPSGNIIHKDGRPIRDPNNKVLGVVNPDWVGGINNEFNYKGVSLGVLVDGKMGGSIYSMTNAWGRYAGVLEETLLGRENGIVGDGVMNIGSEESPVYVENNKVVTAQAYNHAAFGNSVGAGSVFDASFVKLRQVSLGYQLPNSILGSLPLRDVRLSLVGRNLALLYVEAPHIDPETAFTNSNAQGIEHAQLPSARSYGVNVSLKF
jgi:TonB-linked SusC/RagA family outer membrane protein